MPANSKHTGMQTGGNSTEANKQLVHRHIDEAWNLGRLNTVSELLDENVRVHDPVFPNLTSGAQNVRNHIEGCRRAFPDLKFTIDDTVAERDEVVIHWTAKGTHKGDFLGMRPTNRPATVTGTSIYRVQGSHIVEEWSHWNLMSMMEQLGVNSTGTPSQAAAPAQSRATRKPHG